ncbi:MAG: metallophosphoesterase [Planctomycetia bacterium]|nr:metallophosphoesterase [Planctomycetia bacterium]
MNRRFCLSLLVLVCGLFPWGSLVAEAPPPTQIVLLSDIHLGTEVIRRGLSEFRTNENFQRCVDEILKREPCPDAVIILGDIAERHSLEVYQLAAKMWQPILDAGIPLYIMGGNHDSPARMFQAIPALEKQTEVPGKIACRISFPQADFYLLETTDYSNGMLGKLYEDQRKWLLETLPQSGDKPIFLLGHHPLDVMRELPDFSTLPNFQAWIYGHTHIPSLRKTPQGWLLVNVPSTAFDNQKISGLGYFILTLNGEDFSLEKVFLLESHPENGTVETFPYRKTPGILW